MICPQENVEVDAEAPPLVPGHGGEATPAEGEEGHEIPGPADDGLDRGRLPSPRVARAPREPSRPDREKHEISHLPPMLWCKHCRRGRVIAGPHRAQGAERAYPIISLDYAYLGMTTEEDEARHRSASERVARDEAPVDDTVPPSCICILVWHDSSSEAVGAIAVGRKGASWRVQQYSIA